MISLKTRLKIHTLAKRGVPHRDIAESCSVSIRSVQRVVKEPCPTAKELAQGTRTGAARIGRPSKATAPIIARVRAMLKRNPSLMATDVYQRAIGWGYTGSRSSMSALVKRLREAPEQRKPTKTSRRHRKPIR